MPTKHAAPKKELAPRRLSGLLAPWSPFREVELFRNAVTQAYADFMSGNGFAAAQDLLSGRPGLPPVDVEETGKEYLFSVALPGLAREDVKIEVKQGLLSVSGERKAEKETKGRNYLRREQSYGAFRRSFTLPADAESERVKASFKNGVLRIAVARNPAARPKHVRIEAS